MDKWGHKAKSSTFHRSSFAGRVTIDFTNWEIGLNIGGWPMPSQNKRSNL